MSILQVNEPGYMNKECLSVYLLLVVGSSELYWYCLKLENTSWGKGEQIKHWTNEKTTLSCTLVVLNHVCCFKCLCQTTFSLLCFRTASFSLKTGFPLPEGAQKVHDLYFASGCRFFKAVWFLKRFLNKLIKATSPPIVKICSDLAPEPGNLFLKHT